MVTLFFIMPLVCLVILINIALGCVWVIHLGYGPPDWKIALNQIVRLTDLQRYYKSARVWIAVKSPYVEKTLDRLNVPKELTLVPVVKVRASDQGVDGADSGAVRDGGGQQEEKPWEPDTQDAEREKPEADQFFFESGLSTALSDKGTEAWLVNDKNIETSLMKLNVVLMQSGRFLAQLDESIRAAGAGVTDTEVKRFIEALKDDCKYYLKSQAATEAELKDKFEKFGDLKPLAEELKQISAEQRVVVESALRELDGLSEASTPAVSAKMLLQEINSFRVARHQLRDMREAIFTKLASKENRLENVPKALQTDAVSGLRGRIGIELALNDWWKTKKNAPTQCSLALLDFVNFGKTNQKEGLAFCDKIIQHFGNTVKEAFDPLDIVGVYTGNCFFVADNTLGIEKMIEQVERLRQKLEKTTYKLKTRGSAILLKLTAAVSVAGGSAAETLAALENTLKAAKAAGKNCTFQHQANSEPQKIVSKDLNEQVVEVVLE